MKIGTDHGGPARVIVVQQVSTVVHFTSRHGCWLVNFTSKELAE